jgi:GNAT superfamily N-acetyltransferase
MTGGRAPVLARALRVYREKGLAGVWFGALARAGYRRLVALERPLDEPVVAPQARVEAQVRPLDAADADACAALGQIAAGEFRGELERGRACWGAWCDGGLRHVQWVAFTNAWVEHLGCGLLLDGDAAYVYRAFTEPRYRGLGLTPATQAACLPALRERGYRLAVCAVVPENPWAFTPWLRVGYRRTGVLRSVGLGGRRRAWFSSDRGVAAPRRWRVDVGATRP